MSALKDLVEAVKQAAVRRDPRHRVSMLVNDWQRIEFAIAAAEREIVADAAVTSELLASIDADPAWADLQSETEAIDGDQVL